MPLRDLDDTAEDTLEADRLRIRLDVRIQAVRRDLLADADNRHEFRTLLEQAPIALRIGGLPSLECLVGNQFAAEPAVRIRDRGRDVHVEFARIVQAPATGHLLHQGGIVAVGTETVADGLLLRRRRDLDIEIRYMGDEVDVELVEANRPTTVPRAVDPWR